MHRPHHKPGPRREKPQNGTFHNWESMPGQPDSREQSPLRLNKRKESRGGSDVLTFHARPQTTCPAHTAPAPCRLQDRADATDAMVLLTPRRPATCACPLSGVAVPATED